MKKSISAVVAAVVFTTVACSPSKNVRKDSFGTEAHASSSSSDGAEGGTLTHEQARLRARQVGHVSYSLWFGLDDKSQDYQGRTTIHFQLKDLKKLEKLGDAARIVTVDMDGGSIDSIKVNGTRVSMTEVHGLGKTPRFNGHRILFHSSELDPTGSNRIEIAYTHGFSDDGEGFHRFKDPVDGEIYLYTDFEPFRAHRLFPCFDQPDLKASYEVTVEAPASWQVVSNTLEREVTKVDGRRSWAFPPSPIFSTYVFALHAGPFAMWKADAKGIPMRLFARKSLKNDVDYKEWFNITRRGLEFYQAEFAYPYPYSKYDQILVPDFEESAMENVAAITLTENYVFRSPPTADQRRDRTNTILHEMAHMWFGDLVTMHWWNSLWLNESFATYMAAKANGEAMGDPAAWQDLRGDKEWAYWEDQLVTTHPVEVTVADTDRARTIFDGISYGKGGSALKQLAYYLGEEDFREGIRRYFQKYALRNTSTTDFIRTLGEASGKNLSQWQKSWLLTSGLNGLRADWACESGKISRFSLHQTAPEGGTELRTHKTMISFYDSVGNRLSLRKKDSLIAEYSGADTAVVAAVGKSCPAFVFPNQDDYDYAKLELDPVSLEAAKKEIGTLKEDPTREALWSTFWQMAVDGKIPAREYADTAIAQMPHEKNPEILSRCLLPLTLLTPSRQSVAMYLPAPQRAAFLARVEAFLIKNLKNAPAGSDLQRVWWQQFSAMAFSPKAVAFAQSLLSGHAHLSGMKIAQKERWDLITVLARGGAPDAQTLIAEELKKDNTDMGQRASVKAEASMPDAQSKAKWLQRILQPLAKSKDDQDALPLPKLRDAISTYYSMADETSMRQAENSYFESLPKLATLPEGPYASWFSERMFPALCEPALIQRIQSVLDSNSGLLPETVRALRIQQQEQQRCIRARALSDKNPGETAE